MIATRLSLAHPAERILRRDETEILDAWRELVQANAEQVRRLSEIEESDDPWGEGYGGSTVDLENPMSTAVHVATLLRADDSLLDIGAGFGGTMLPVASQVRKVTALDPSPGMVEKLQENIQLHGITNVDVLEPMLWPPDEPIEQHDVCLASAVVYEVADIGPFLDALERHARRLCIVLVAEWGTGFTPYEPLFEELHGEAYIRPPAFREFIDLLSAWRRRFNVLSWESLWPPDEDLDAAMANRGRKNFLVRKGTEKDARLREMLAEHFGTEDGQIALPHPAGNFFAIVSWEPPGA